MNNQQRERAKNSLPSKESSMTQSDNGGLNDVINVVNDVAGSYDVQYTELCHMLEEVIDNMEYIKQYRMTQISGLRNDIEKLIPVADAARKSAIDVNDLEKRREELQRLEKEKQQVVKELLDGKDEVQQLRSKLQSIEQRMNSTRREREAVKDQRESDLPSLEYMKRVLQRLSQVYLTSNVEYGIIEGFVSKNGTNDVRPFRMDASSSHFDQVNNLWNMISEECC